MYSLCVWLYHISYRVMLDPLDKRKIPLSPDRYRTEASARQRWRGGRAGACWRACWRRAPSRRRPSTGPPRRRSRGRSPPRLRTRCTVSSYPTQHTHTHTHNAAAAATGNPRNRISPHNPDRFPRVHSSSSPKEEFFFFSRERGRRNLGI